MAFEEVGGSGGDWFKFGNVGDTFEGYYIGMREEDGKFGPQRVYSFQTVEGNTTQIGGTKLLNQDFDSVTKPVVKGRLTRVTFRKEVPTKFGNPAKVFLVEQDKEKTVDVEDVPF